MNKMSCRFRQNSCAKWKGKKEAFAKKVCNFFRETNVLNMAFIWRKEGEEKKRIE